ncbi:hypothetical protein, partial [Piscinibacter sakaiensis]|uniref:hypothetical protein n=1 Tax=Piscinibacter sakaiensis TaxID=1547922 RepID=UPI0009EA2C23
MTPAERAFDAALRERLRERARTIIGADQAVAKQLVAARQRITELLAAQATDYRRWQLAQLLDQVETVLGAVMGSAAGVADRALRDLWQQGEDFVDKPLAAGGIALELRLPLLDVQQLAAMRAFTLERLKNVGAEAKGKIGTQLGRVVMGVSTPHEAIRAVQASLGDDMPRRAATIVRTETSQAFAVASQQRLGQAAALDERLEKQWRRSGKVHSRWNHDLIDGQRVAASKPFRVPGVSGGVDLMMHPHDPAAPPAQNINCGCISLPRVRGWGVATPGAKPFTQLELDRNPA